MCVRRGGVQIACACSASGVWASEVGKMVCDDSTMGDVVGINCQLFVKRGVGLILWWVTSDLYK